MNEKETKKFTKKKGVTQIIESSLVSIASSFPIAASLASGWSEFKNHKQAERIEQILMDFGKRLHDIESEVDKEYLSSDEAKFVIEQTINAGKDELLLEKRKYLSEFLANSATKKLAQDSEKKMVLDTIIRINPLQALLLETITEMLVVEWGRKNLSLGSDFNPYAKEKATFGYIMEIDLVKTTHIKSRRLATKENLESSLDYMVSIGLIEHASARGWTKVVGVKGFRPTKLGIKILQYLGIDIDEMISKERFDEIRREFDKENPINKK